MVAVTCLLMLVDTTSVIVQNWPKAEPAWLRFLPGVVPGLVGGSLAVVAGRVAQNHRESLDRKRNRGALERRVAFFLASAVELGNEMKTLDASVPVPENWCEDILSCWRGFDRLSDNLQLLGDPTFETELWVLLDKLRMRSESILTWERRFEATQAAGPTSDAAKKLRTALIKAFCDLSGEVTSMLERFTKLSGTTSALKTKKVQKA